MVTENEYKESVRHWTEEIILVIDKANNLLQLQTLNSITEKQLKEYINTKVGILGVAGGNGLEHINKNTTKRVYGIDINKKYLNKCKERYLQLEDILELICCDLSDYNTNLPFTNILICNLIIEYLGVNKFIKLIKNNKKNITIISCVIQKNYKNNFVSNSNLTSAFDPLMSIHNNIEANNLLNEFKTIGFCCLKKIVYPLPNSKEFIRYDFKKNS